MSGITRVMVERKGSNDDDPRGITGGEGSGIVGRDGRLCKELSDLRASRVVFGDGLGGHRGQTSQRGPAIPREVRTGRKGRRYGSLCGWTMLGHVTRLCQKLKGGAVDGIISRGRGGIADGV